MKRQKVKLTLPAIKKIRETIANGNLVASLVETGKEMNAKSVKVKYTLKDCSWVVTVEVRRRDNIKYCEQL